MIILHKISYQRMITLEHSISKRTRLKRSQQRRTRLMMGHTQRRTPLQKTKNHLTQCNPFTKKRNNRHPNSPSWRRGRLWSRYSKRRHTVRRVLCKPPRNNHLYIRRNKCRVKRQTIRTRANLQRSHNSISLNYILSKGTMTSSSIKLSSIIKKRRAIVTMNRRRSITQTKKMIRALMIFSMTHLINKIIIIKH